MATNYIINVMNMWLKCICLLYFQKAECSLKPVDCFH